MQRLLAAGLLRQIDADTVILPRLVGQVMRGEVAGTRRADAARPRGVDDDRQPTSTRSPPEPSSTCCAKSSVVLETLGATPVPELRSGGLGVREVKRLTKVTGIDEHRLGLVLEVAAAAGLIAAGMPEPEPLDGAGPYWAPTVAADRFVESPAAARWHLLASTWLDLPGRPGPDRQPRAGRQTLCRAV